MTGGYTPTLVLKRMLGDFLKNPSLNFKTEKKTMKLLQKRNFQVRN